MSLANTGNGAAKLRLVADMSTAYKNLNAVLKDTEKLTKSIAANIQAASGKKGSAPGDSMSFANANNGAPSRSGFMEQGTISPGSTSPNGFKQPGRESDAASSMKAFGAAAASAINAGTDAGAYIENDVSRRRFGFYQGIGGDAGAAAGSSAFNMAMRQGTPTDPMDAARAAMIGTQYGMGNRAGLSSAATLSNLVPGAGLAGSMQGMTALNSARNVNMARMIGINIRDDKTGMMREFKDIAKDIYEFLKKNKRDNTPITAAELQLSLQPGGQVSNMLDMYFSGDPVLREGIVSALYQLAAGGNFTKKSLAETGANPTISQSIGERNRKKYQSQDQSTSGGIAGIEAGNATVNFGSDILTALGPLKEIATMLTTITQTISGAGGGGAGTTTGMGGGAGTTTGMGGGSMGGETFAIGGGTVAPVNNYASNITSGYGPRNWVLDKNGNRVRAKNPKMHKGLDIAMPAGTPIHAAKDGRVVNIGMNMSKENGFGHSVTIQHDDGYQSVYAHMLETPLVNKGDTVSAGDPLGKVGRTGASTGNHLHFQVQSGNKTIDPLNWLSGAENSSGTASSVTADLSNSTSLFGSTASTTSLFKNSPTTPKKNGMGGGSESVSGGLNGSMVAGGRSGGVTVHINVQGGNFNEEKLALEVRRVLNDDARIRDAVRR
jgi:murein DD-endopeptidase MepM/ murein hydrolase activator NlpD